MKFKTYKAARNHIIACIEKAGIDVRDINIDLLMSDLFRGRGVGVDFELEQHPLSDTFTPIVRALRIPRRGTVSDKHWEATVRRLGAYMGVFYTAGDPDELARDITEHGLFAQFMMKEAL